VIFEMKQNLSASELALYSAIDEVLHYIWDPIGVASCPQARDEYHGYLSEVYTLISDGSNVNAIAHYLTQVTTARMGLSENVEHDLKIAHILIEWKACLAVHPPN